MSFIEEVAGNLVGAGVGAFLGYLFAVHQEKKSRIEREQNRKKAMIKSILEECHYNSDVSGDRAVIDIRQNGDEKENLTYNDVWVAELSTSVLESVLSSGSFDLLDPDLQVSLSMLLMELKKTNREANRIGMQLPMKKSQILKRKEKIDKSCESVLYWIDLIKENVQDIVKATW